jgi:hypothetical protein
MTTTPPCSLWQLLVQAKARTHMANMSTAAVSMSHNGKLARYVDMHALVNTKKIQIRSVNTIALECGYFFEQRLLQWRHLPVGTRERFARWEVMKISMMHGLVHDGVVVDKSEGRVIRVPLQMGIVPLTGASLGLRREALAHPQVQRAIFVLWEEMVQRGGIDVPTYFSMSKMVIEILLLHLSDREIHQLITMEVELDIADPGGNMTAPEFIRWVGGLALLWMETHTIAEALSFVQEMSNVFLRPIECFDLRFAAQFTRKDPSLLIPSLAVGAACLESDAALVSFARDQLAISIRVRFGSLLSEKPLAAKARMKKRQGKAAKPGHGFFMTPTSESHRAYAVEEEVARATPDNASLSWLSGAALQSGMTLRGLGNNGAYEVPPRKYSQVSAVSTSVSQAKRAAFRSGPVTMVPLHVPPRMTPPPTTLQRAAVSLLGDGERLTSTMHLKPAKLPQLRATPPLTRIAKIGMR